MNGYDRSLHERLTEILMENGCSVTKKGVDELIRWIGARDAGTVDKVIRDAEETKKYLQYETVLGDTK